MRAIVVALLVTLVAGCNKNNSPTTPTAPTPPAAAPSVTEEFIGTLRVGGFTFYSFTVTVNGTVNLTLNSVTGSGVASTVALGIGIGTPDAEDCAATQTMNTEAGTSVQLSGTYAPGVHCARVYDIGNLEAPATFNLSIAHP